MVFIHREEGKVSYETNEEKIDILEHILYNNLSDFIKFPSFDVPENMVMTYVISCKQGPKIKFGDNKRSLRIHFEYSLNQIVPYKVMNKGGIELNLNVETRKIEGSNTKKYFDLTEINNLFIISKEK